MESRPNLIIEIDHNVNYDKNIQVNYNNINSSDGGYHVMSRLQTLLSKGTIYQWEAQDSEIIEIYIKNNHKYFYKGQWNLNSDSNDESIRSDKNKDDNQYKTVIKPTSENILFTFYKNGEKVNSIEYEYSTQLGNNYFEEPLDKELFTKFSLPKTSKFEPYLSETKINILKKQSVEDLKKQRNTYIHEKYLKKLNFNEEELKELRDLELIRAN
ncbi:hypothetical protein G9F32_13660 [Acinetobacter sp. 194]|uniref:hypothetical protein n=1 Tax=Acinetobacter shaoyimingii TaxID=2715164 RepID=UPI00140A83B0|nr:hypothetical protein [Acinetobacter shaoyimingii]NHB59049.1 hypothetical protein [Acinetobacter shaoyimingii]